MSETDDEGTIRVSRDGISVEKRLEREAFPVPAVGFEIHAERNTPSTVRLVDPIPESVSPNDVGFHAEYDEDCWRVEDDTAVFERDVAPGEEHTTFYAIREADVADIESELVDPGLTVTPLPPSDEGPLAADDPITQTDERPPATDATPRTDPETGQLALSGSVASTLAAELRRGSVNEADRAQLRDALDLGGDPERMESLLADTLAQTEALETALGDGGDIPRLLESVSDGMETIQHDIGDLTDRIDTLDERIESLEDDTEGLESLEDDVEELTAWRRRMGALFSGEEPAGRDAESNEETDS